jgi:hypothetical protein
VSRRSQRHHSQGTATQRRAYNYNIAFWDLWLIAALRIVRSYLWVRPGRLNLGAHFLKAQCQGFDLLFLFREPRLKALLRMPQRDIIAAGSVVRECRNNDGRIVAASSVVRESSSTDGRVVSAGVVKERALTDCDVEAASSVTKERVRTDSRVDLAAGVAEERERSISRVAVAGGMA